LSAADVAVLLTIFDRDPVDEQAMDQSVLQQ